MTDLLISRLASQLKYELRAFDGALQRLQSFSYPTGAAQQLIAELRDEAETQGKSIEQTKSDYREVPEELHELLAIEHRNIAVKTRLLRYIERAQTPEVPWSFVGSIERLADAIVPGRPVLTCCMDDYTYNIQPCPDHRHLILILPRLHRLNVLWHTTIGHEFFHPILKQFLEKRTTEVAWKIARACMERYTGEHPNARTQLAGYSSEPERLDTYIGRCQKLWRRATEELLCDLGCACLFGPASMMTLLSRSLSYRLDALPTASNRFYPPLRYRFRVVRDHIYADSVKILDQLGSRPDIARFLGPFRKALNEFDRLASATTDDAVLKTRSDTSIAYEEVQRSISDGWEFIQSKIPAEVACWRDTYNQVPALLERLDNRVPPSEIQSGTPPNFDVEPAHLSAILLAGWIYESSWTEESQTGGNRDTIDYFTLMRLILKACEDSELRRSYNEHRNAAAQQ